LAPFHSDTIGTNWTAQRVRQIEQFGYTYPELAGNATAASVRTAVNTLYGDRASIQTQQQDVTAREDGQSAVATNPAYTADIVSQKFAVNGSYAIYVFLGNVSDDASAWPLAPNLVGTHGIFTGKSRPMADSRDGPQSFEVGPTVKVTGSVPLTSALLDRVRSGELVGMDESAVQSFLSEQLHWRIAKVRGQDDLEGRNTPRNC
jgi:tyrosinase